MITLITGENSFENERKIKQLIAEFEGLPERFDGAALELRQLPDLLMGGTLFASKRLVIIRGLSENKTLWNDFGDWTTRVTDDVHLMLVETKPDKRTKTYKQLQKAAEVYESKIWTDRDSLMAQRWVEQEAASLGFNLDKKCMRLLVERVGVDQWLLYRALEKLAAMQTVTPELIEDIIEANPMENVFNVFEGALRGDSLKVKKMLATLELTEEPYRLFGLLGTQGFQLAALCVAEGRTSAEVAKDLGAHPFALSKLAPYAGKLGVAGGKKVSAAFAEADASMKTSAEDPWLLIERLLVKIANI
jgi:DNA polymerase III delta subunit